MHGMGKTDERNSTCGALFPAVTMSFGIELARSFSFVRSFVLSFFLSLSLSLSLVFVANLFEHCHTFEAFFQRYP